MDITHGKSRKIPVNDNVDLLVRRVSITEVGPSPRTIEAIELREYLRNAEVEGHGIFVPLDEVSALMEALGSV